MGGVIPSLLEVLNPDSVGDFTFQILWPDYTRIRREVVCVSLLVGL